MIGPEHALPICRQAQLLELSRSAVYYQPIPVSDDDLALMRRIDELHLEHPFAGSRMLKRLLRGEGHEVGRCHVRTLMRRMGIEAIYRRPRTSEPHPGHRIFPYLLRGQVIDRPNQVWALDITYLPMKRGFVYLVSVLDWASRRVLAWRLSNTLTADDFCVEALDQAIRRYGAPDIVNTDQGAQLRFKESLQRYLRVARSSSWMAGTPGATRSSSNAFGARSNTRRSTFVPMTASAMHVDTSNGT